MGVESAALDQRRVTVTDRELLERAAKAAGMTIIEWYGEEEPNGPWAVHEPRGPHLGWNPLTDDGDALRLAVKLDMLWENLESFDMFFDSMEPDKQAATRRAIVRAAAEIGRSME